MRYVNLNKKNTGRSHNASCELPVSFYIEHRKRVLSEHKTVLCFRKRPAPAFGPELHHMGKDAARLQQLCGRALLGYRAVPEHHDLVCAGDGAHPVGDDEDGFVFD